MPIYQVELCEQRKLIPLEKNVFILHAFSPHIYFLVLYLKIAIWYGQVYIGSLDELSIKQNINFLVTNHDQNNV